MLHSVFVPQILTEWLSFSFINKIVYNLLVTLIFIQILCIYHQKLTNAATTQIAHFPSLFCMQGYIEWLQCTYIHRPMHFSSWIPTQNIALKLWWEFSMQWPITMNIAHVVIFICECERVKWLTVVAAICILNSWWSVNKNSHHSWWNNKGIF